jgi:hypothetical protein
MTTIGLRTSSPILHLNIVDDSLRSWRQRILTTRPRRASMIPATRRVEAVAGRQLAGELCNIFTSVLGRSVDMRPKDSALEMRPVSFHGVHLVDAAHVFLVRVLVMCW